MFSDPRILNWPFCFTNVTQAACNDDYIKYLSINDWLVTDIQFYSSKDAQNPKIKSWDDIVAWYEKNAPRIELGLYNNGYWGSKRQDQDNGKNDQNCYYGNQPTLDGYYLAISDDLPPDHIGNANNCAGAYPNANLLNVDKPAARDLIIKRAVYRAAKYNLKHSFLDNPGNLTTHPLAFFKYASMLHKLYNVKFIANLAAWANFLIDTPTTQAFGTLLDGVTWEMEALSSNSPTSPNRVPISSPADLQSWLLKLQVLSNYNCLNIFLPRVINGDFDAYTNLDQPFFVALSLMLGYAVTARAFYLPVPSCYIWASKLGRSLGNIQVSPALIITCGFEHGSISIDANMRIVTVNVK